MDRPRTGLRRWARIAFGTLGVLFLLAALVRQWEDVRDGIEFSVARLAVAAVLIAISIMSLAHGWARLMPGTSDRQRMRKIFYLSQPAKYIPGGVVQPVGQVALTTDEGVSAGHSITAFIVHSVASATGGALLGAGMVFVTDVPTWLRACAAVGLIAPVILWQPVLLKAGALVARILRRPFREELLPRQKDTVIALGWALLGIAASATAFAVVAGDSIDIAGWVVVSAYSLAFTIGFLAVPFPSGIGIREGALALLLPATGLATIVAVSALHRLVSMLAELSVLGSSQRDWRGSRRVTPP